MNYATRKGATCFIAMAKDEPFTQSVPDPITEPGELYFEFGETEAEAMENLKNSLEPKE